MAIAPYLLALSLVAGELRAENSLSEQLLPSRAALQEELPEIAVSRLRKLMESEQFQAADESARNAALSLLGESLVRISQYESARKVLIELPDSSIRNYWLGVAQARLGNDDDALAAWQQIPDEDAQLGTLAQFNRLKILTLREESEEALALLAALQTKDPDFRTVELALTEATLLLQSNRTEAAKEALSQLPDQNPRVLTLAGRIELAAQDPAEALVFFDKSLADEPSPKVRELALLGKGDALLAQEKDEAALDTFLELLALAPDQQIQLLLFPRLDLLVSSSAKGESGEQQIAAFRNFLETPSLEPAETPRQIASYYLARLLPEEAGRVQLQDLLDQPTLGAFLRGRTGLKLAESYLGDGQEEEATAQLAETLAASPETRAGALAADLLARLATKAERLAEAETYFAQAAQHPSPDFSEAALLNQALLALAEDPTADLSSIAARLPEAAQNPSLELAKALAAARRGGSDARDSLTLFLSANSDHPRVGEAQLALVSILLNEDRPDIARIEALLDSLSEEVDPDFAQARFLASHQLGAISDQWALAVRYGERALKANPALGKDPYFLLRIAESRFRNGDYVRARFLFGEVSQLEGSGDLEEVALYFAARANLAIPTDKATLEALAILEELMERSGPLSTKARLLKARTLLQNLGRAEDSLAVLALLPGDLGGQPAAALLAAEAHRELGRGEPAQFQKAITIYQTLLDDERTSYARSNQLHYLIARTHRESGHPELALEPCLAVVDFENRNSESAPIEWDFYYQCGFEALDLLLEAQRYRPALLLARKLAATTGPGATQAQERADQIQLEHMILTD